MALSANTVFEVHTGGNDTNGGGFVTGATGTDYSLIDTKRPNGGTDGSSVIAVANGTTTISCADANFAASIIGNIVYFAGGTGSIAAQWRQVLTRPSSTTITIDAAIAASVGMTMNVGGALLSPSVASALMTVGGMLCYVLNIGGDGASVYSITTATINTVGGTIGATGVVTFQGYTTNRVLGNTDARPTLQLNVSTATLFSTAGLGYTVWGFVCDGNGQTTAKANSGMISFINCLCKNFNTASTGNALWLWCAFTTNSAQVPVGIMHFCESYNNTSTQFIMNTIQAITNCISANDTGATTDAFYSDYQNGTFINCIAYNPGRDGFRITNTVVYALINCHSEGATGKNYNAPSNSKSIINCSTRNGTNTITLTGATVLLNLKTITAGVVFTNAGAGDFTLNNIVNQGALLRAAGFPSTFPRGLTANYRDIGAAQHQDSGGSNTFIFPIFD
jgi:hypothetical protein